jgi:excisionase family DNA binding protein
MPHSPRSTASDEPLCVKDVAKILGCSVRTVFKLMDEGVVSGWRYGQRGRWHFDRLEVLLYIQRRKTECDKSHDKSAALLNRHPNK